MDCYWDFYYLIRIVDEMYYASLNLEFLLKITKDNKIKKLFLKYKQYNKRIILRLYQTGFG